MDLSRYVRQTVHPKIGEEGQRRLAAGRVAVAGCGAVGSAVASLCVRAGIGYVRLIDRDTLELNNLQRQLLYDEEDVAAGLPKVVAAARKLRRLRLRVATGCASVSLASGVVHWSASVSRASASFTGSARVSLTSASFTGSQASRVLPTAFRRRRRPEASETLANPVTPYTDKGGPDASRSDKERYP